MITFIWSCSVTFQQQGFGHYVTKSLWRAIRFWFSIVLLYRLYSLHVNAKSRPKFSLPVLASPCKCCISRKRFIAYFVANEIHSEIFYSRMYAYVAAVYLVAFVSVPKHHSFHCLWVEFYLEKSIPNILKSLSSFTPMSLSVSWNH